MSQIECDTSSWKTNDDIPAEHRMNGPNVLWLFVPPIWIQKGLKRRFYWIERGMDGNPKVRSYGPASVVLTGIAMATFYFAIGYYLVTGGA